MDAALVTWRNVLFSITNTPLSQSDRDALANVKASWVLLNNRNGRFFVDIIGPVAQLQNIQDALVAMGRDPKVIGIFDADGVLLNTSDNAEWLNVARDVRTYDAQGNLLTSTRPVAYQDIHRWGGWATKNI